ncbi:MAG TPA: helix-turn-helix domain-containing protein [Methylotenera sp.]|nr:helix-turn-helix domain-containing protein [Methylotenera sp.]
MEADNKLLSLDKKTRKKLEKVADLTHPDAARARALLALDDGLTQTAAATHAGLTLPQLRYWLGRFRSKQLECFSSLNDGKPAKPKVKKADKSKTDKKAKGNNKKSKKSDKKKNKKDKKSAKKKKSKK